LVIRLGGTLHFGKLHMKPGQPSTFVTIPPSKKFGGGTTPLVFALPGNPVSATVCTHLLVRPCLDLLFCGAEQEDVIDDNNIDSGRGVGGNSSGGGGGGDHDEESVEQLLHRVVQHSTVHQEVVTELSHDIKLDTERPEYHRVTLHHNNNEAATASSTLQQQSTTGMGNCGDNDIVFQGTSTGVQRSSRLASMLNCTGLAVLPQASQDKPVATKGERYPVLLVSSQRNSLIRRMRVCDSMHLNSSNNKTKITKTTKSLRVAIVQVDAPYSNITEFDSNLIKRVRDALSDTRNGSATIVSTSVYYSQKSTNQLSVDSGNIGDNSCGGGLYQFCKTQSKAVTADILVILCRSSALSTAGKKDGTFRYFLKHAKQLQSCLVKVNGALALEARRGCANQCSVSALFEVVVGYMISQEEDCDDNGANNNYFCHGTMVIFLPEPGLDDGLANVRGLLKHGLQIARGGHRSG